jgi:hypothetical protein
LTENIRVYPVRIENKRVFLNMSWAFEIFS